MCGCGEDVVVAGMTVKQITVAITLTAAPVGVFISSAVGAFYFNGTRRRISIILLAVTGVFLVALGFSTLGHFVQGNFLNHKSQQLVLSFPFLATSVWAYGIINHPSDPRWVDRISLYGIYISALAAFFLFLVLGQR